MQHILSLSYGKDSLACLGAIELIGWPLDRIVHAEVWATDTIPADLPPMVEFKARADEIIKSRWGITVEHVRADETAVDRIYHKRTRGNRVGQRMGWPRIKGCDLQRDLKVGPIKKAQREGIVYLGIAADEPERLKRLNDTRKSPLAAAGWTESQCREWCERNDLLSPIYTDSARGGCWFCPCQPVGQLRLLRRNHPDYWALMLKWDSDSPTRFKADGQTVHDYERRFQMEDEGMLSPGDKRFRWAMLDNPPDTQMILKRGEPLCSKTS